MASEQISNLRQRYRQLERDDRESATDIANASLQLSKTGGPSMAQEMGAFKYVNDQLRDELEGLLVGRDPARIEDADTLRDANSLLHRIVRQQKEFATAIRRKLLHS